MECRSWCAPTRLLSHQGCSVCADVGAEWRIPPAGPCLPSARGIRPRRGWRPGPKSGSSARRASQVRATTTGGCAPATRDRCIRHVTAWRSLAFRRFAWLDREHATRHRIGLAFGLRASDEFPRWQSAIRRQSFVREDVRGWPACPVRAHRGRASWPTGPGPSYRFPWPALRGDCFAVQDILPESSTLTNRYSLRIPQRLYDAMLAQARAELPNECCGLL